MAAIKELIHSAVEIDYMITNTDGVNILSISLLTHIFLDNGFECSSYCIKSLFI